MDRRKLENLEKTHTENDNKLINNQLPLSIEPVIFSLWSRRTDQNNRPEGQKAIYFQIHKFIYPQSDKKSKGG